MVKKKSSSRRGKAKGNLAHYKKMRKYYRTSLGQGKAKIIGQYIKKKIYTKKMRKRLSEAFVEIDNEATKLEDQLRSAKPKLRSTKYHIAKRFAKRRLE